MRQVGLITAGSQPWNSDICAACGEYFAYCSSLAIYVYKFDALLKDYRLYGILAWHKFRIVCISWNQIEKEFLVSADTKNIVIWNVVSKSKVYEIHLSESYNSICSIFWKVCESCCVAFLCEKDGLITWNYHNKEELKPWRGAKSFTSDPCIARCHMNECKVAIGHNNGTISLVGCDKLHKNVLSPELANENEMCKVKELLWDPLSSDYLLALTQNNMIRLIDVNAINVVMMFNLISNNQISCMTWISNAPGMFITTEIDSSKLSIWNVSQSSPMLTVSIKVKTITNFHSILFIASNDADKKQVQSSNQGKIASSGSLVELPPGRILSTFSDGGVGLYNLRSKKWDFYKEMGHTETIFDCEFHPSDPNILASAGFDGNLKIWNISDMTLMNSRRFPGIIYSVSWAWGGSSLAVATDKNGVQVWNVVNNNVEYKFEEHVGKIYGVAWSQRDPFKLASCGDDGNLIIRDLNIPKVICHKHPTGVYGCDWNPKDISIIATGCGDGRIRLLRVEASPQEGVKMLSGHDARVFQVKWSPIHDGILLSGSDDCTIKLWDTQKEECLRTMVGHSRPVRGLMWSPELHNIVFSGSWDSLVLVWDLKTGHFIESIKHHGADVYGLACHPKRPFLIASSSRDSTIRLTDVSKLVLPLHVQLILGRPFDDVCLHSSVPLPLSPSDLGLHGNHSKKLLELTSPASNQLKMKQIYNFFKSAPDLENFWNLIDVHLGKDVSLMPTSYKHGIIHIKHLLNFKTSEALDLESGGGKLVGRSSKIDGKSDRLRRAFQLQLSLGNMERCCEILVQLEEWDKALALAPSVSMKFWKSLMERRCSSLKKEEAIDEENLSYFASLGRSDELVNYFTSHGSHADAMMVAATDWSGGVGSVSEDLDSMERGDCSPARERFVNSNIRKIMNEMADKYFYSGQPILAACCHMAVDDVEELSNKRFFIRIIFQLAMSKLIRGGEWELVIHVGNMLDNVAGFVYEAAKCLARRCEKENLRHQAIELLNKYVAGDERRLLLGEMCCRYVTEGRYDLLARSNLPSSKECKEKAEELLKCDNGGNYFDVVFHFLLSDDWSKGLEIGVAKVKEIMSNEKFNPNDVQHLVQIMSSLNKDKLNNHPELKQKLMAMSAYVGVLRAIKRGYVGIISYLFQCTINMLAKEDVDIGISKGVISKELQAWISSLRGDTKSDIFDELSRKAELLTDSYEFVERGDDVMTGSLLPSHGVVSSVSLFTKQAIQGQSHILEDGCWAISINDAIMWAKVNNLSPYCSGEQINPF